MISKNYRKKNTRKTYKIIFNANKQILINNDIKS